MYFCWKIKLWRYSFRAGFKTLPIRPLAESLSLPFGHPTHKVTLLFDHVVLRDSYSYMISQSLGFVRLVTY